MEIRWSLPAAEDLERICAWIERDNPEAARRVAEIIYDGCAKVALYELLAAEPTMCRFMCVINTLSLVQEEDKTACDDALGELLINPEPCCVSDAVQAHYGAGLVRDWWGVA